MQASPTPLQLSVVVPTFNDAGILRHTLACLAAQSLAPGAYEVIVVDDGSTDATPAVVAAAARGRTTIRGVRLERNSGRSAARNAGIRAAQSSVIVFIDSDILVRSDFLQHHVAMHRDAGRPVVGRGPVVSIPAPAVPDRTPLIRTSPAYLDTANASIPRQTLIDAGLFDEGFRVYGWEDFDLGLRLQARGIHRVFDPSAVGFHVQPPAGDDSLERHLIKEEERAHTALYLLRKHPGIKTRILIQDTALQRAVHFVLGGVGLLTVGNAQPVARWLRGHEMHTLASLVIRGVLNRHYLRSLDRFRALPEGR